MYDTVKLSYSLLDNIVPKDTEVFNNLVNITESIDVHTQSNWITGKAKNMVIRRNANSITVQGSLPKYQYGNNLQTLQRADTGLIIEELSDLISTDLRKARLQRVDFSTNIITEHKPQYYYRFLGHLTRFPTIPLYIIIKGVRNSYFMIRLKMQRQSKCRYLNIIRTRMY